MGWDRKFNEPIPLPRGKPLVTLRDVATYITKLPKAERNAPEWQAAMQALLLSFWTFRRHPSLAPTLLAGRRIDFAPRLDRLRYLGKSSAFTSGAFDFYYSPFRFGLFHKNHFLK